MKTKIRPPELLEAIAAHARAVLAGDIETAERYVVPGALGTYRTAFAEAARLGPFDAYAAPGLARLGTQYISKIRFESACSSALMQVRWTCDKDGARWLVAEAEYFPPGRTPWTGVSRPRPAAWSSVNASENENPQANR
jgi:hypothetical protein